MNSVSLQFAEYRGDPAELSARIDRFLLAAGQKTLDEDPAALVVPHAGYVYSGPIAAFAYGAVKGKHYDTVVVVGPSHRVPFTGISLFQADRFDTPLGSIPMDLELTRSILASHRQILSLPQAHQQEHSVEVQIPFLQRSLGPFSLVMAVIGQYSPEAEQAFVEALMAAAAAGKRILLVASSDLSHYHDYDTAARLDAIALDLVQSMDARRLLASARSGSCELCGLLPVHLAMEYARRRGYGRVSLLKAASSGDTAGGRDQVVGYASLAFLPVSGPGGSESGNLSPAQRRRLLTIARETITQYVRSGTLPPIQETDPVLSAQNGAFVTIKRRGQLRGCIGNFVSRDPLYRTIMTMAVAASTQDPRFTPMTPVELNDMDLEISVLTPMRLITDVKEIQVGRHGLYLVKGRHSGTLLPQVAAEYGWDRLTFLEQTCRKAGLPPDAWKEGAEIYVYEAEVFGED
jgi:hypothetical protein